MPELRRDPIVGRWVIIATDRANRPQQPRCPPAAPGGLCPFCPGSEDKTPREVYVSGRAHSAHPNSVGWKVRVIPNRFPALMIEGELERQAEGIYDRMNGVGAHEVIVETPEHGKMLADLSDEEVTEVLFAFKARILDLRNDLRFRYILLFKNSGSAAGASLEHTHSQLIALPITPRQVGEEIEGARRHFEHRERCIFCDIVGQERKDRSRLVYENEEFVAFAPWAPRSPFETWIMPKRHESNYEAEPKERLAYCAQALRTTLRRIRIEVMPALSQSVAGFEWGSGFHINPVPPEEAAEFLRKVGSP